MLVGIDDHPFDRIQITEDALGFRHPELKHVFEDPAMLLDIPPGAF